MGGRAPTSPSWAANRSTRARRSSNSMPLRSLCSTPMRSSSAALPSVLRPYESRRATSTLWRVPAPSAPTCACNRFMGSSSESRCSSSIARECCCIESRSAESFLAVSCTSAFSRKASDLTVLSTMFQRLSASRSSSLRPSTSCANSCFVRCQSASCSSRSEIRACSTATSSKYVLHSSSDCASMRRRRRSMSSWLTYTACSSSVRSSCSTPAKLPAAAGSLNRHSHTHAVRKRSGRRPPEVAAIACRSCISMKSAGLFIALCESNSDSQDAMITELTALVACFSRASSFSSCGGNHCRTC